MGKPLFILYGPLETFSGYGARTKDLAKAILKLNKYDLKIISCKWGACPFGALDPNNPEDKQLLNRIIPGNMLPRQPDIWAMVTVPNEMQHIGKFNMLITAGIETTVCDPSWIEGCSRADLVLVSSNHAKQVFLNSKFEKKDNNTQQILEVIEVKKPVEVLFEGIRTDMFYKTIELEKTSLINSLDQISEDFCFLNIGHWLSGILSEDRKNTGMTIKVFLETFKNKKNPPALILKTSGASSCIIDREEILKKIDEVRKTVKGDLPNIYLLHGDLEDKDINNLYNHPKVKAMVSLTKGEGFGRPLLEFSVTQKPIIVSGWSGQLDFLAPEFNLLVKGEVKQIHPSAVMPNMLIPESGWFTPDYPTAGIYLKDVWENYEKYAEKGRRQAYRSKTWFSFDKMTEKLEELLQMNLPEFPEEKKLMLPKLRKISMPKQIIEI